MTRPVTGHCGPVNNCRRRKSRHAPHHHHRGASASRLALLVIGDPEAVSSAREYTRTNRINTPALSQKKGPTTSGS